MVLCGDDAAGLCSRTEHQILVKRLPGVHVDHAGGNALCCQLLLCLECLVYQNAGGNNGYVLAVARVTPLPISKSEPSAYTVVKPLRIRRM